MLDEKLREIITQITPPGAEDAWIAQIKKCFAESPDEVVKLLWGKSYLSGQEWLNRFKKEYRALSPNAYAKDRYAKMAAERVANET